MASFNSTSRQKELVSVLYSVHENLRKQYRLVNNNEDSYKIWNEKWKEHVENTEQLQEYSKAMFELATEIWNPRHSSSSSSTTTTTTTSKNTSLASNNEGQTNSVEDEEEEIQIIINCRIEWVYLKCLNYFFSKEKIQSIHKNNIENKSSSSKSNCDSEKKLKLLDVGSCFNPFEKYHNIFEITAIDLCPAPGFEETVYKCDFLQVPLVSSSSLITTSSCSIKDKNYNNIIESLPLNYFDVVVFSFFLEYLPDPKQRLESCKKARDILKHGGILFILKPDSNPVTPTNMSFIKKIKVGMALLGFRRIYFEKLKHVWCTAYLKLEESEISHFINSTKVQNELTKLNNSGTLEHYEFFVISQDLKHIVVVVEEQEESKDSQKESLTTTSSCNEVIKNNANQHDAFLFDELPLYISE